MPDDVLASPFPAEKKENGSLARGGDAWGGCLP